MSKIELKPYRRNVYYYETDRMGIVHHSNYIKWFEEARVDFLEQIGYPFTKIEDEGFMIPVLSASCTYKKSFKFGDTFEVEIIPKAFNGIKLIIEYVVRKAGEDEVYSTGETSHCFVDNNMKPVLLKKQAKEIYDVFNDNFLNNKISIK